MTALKADWSSYLNSFALLFRAVVCTGHYLKDKVQSWSYTITQDAQDQEYTWVRHIAHDYTVKWNLSIKCSCTPAANFSSIRSRGFDHAVDHSSFLLLISRKVSDIAMYNLTPTWASCMPKDDVLFPYLQGFFLILLHYLHLLIFTMTLVKTSGLLSSTRHRHVASPLIFSHTNLTAVQDWQKKQRTKTRIAKLDPDQATTTLDLQNLAIAP